VPTRKPSERDDIEGARVDRVRSDESELEDMPVEVEKEDTEISGRKPDLGESEDDTSEL
jgi:hypothetical protein